MPGSSWCDASMRMSTSTTGMPIFFASVITGAAYLPFKGEGSGLNVQSSGVHVQGSGLRVQGLGFRLGS